MYFLFLEYSYKIKNNKCYHFIFNPCLVWACNSSIFYDSGHGKNIYWNPTALNNRVKLPYTLKHFNTSVICDEFFALHSVPTALRHWIVPIRFDRRPNKRTVIRLFRNTPCVRTSGRLQVRRDKNIKFNKTSYTTHTVVTYMGPHTKIVRQKSVYLQSIKSWRYSMLASSRKSLTARSFAEWNWIKKLSTWQVIDTEHFQQINVLANNSTIHLF